MNSDKPQYIDVDIFLKLHPEYTDYKKSLRSALRSSARQGTIPFLNPGRGYSHQYHEADILRYAKRLVTPSLGTPETLYVYATYNDKIYVYTITGNKLDIHAKFTKQEDADRYCSMMNSTCYQSHV